MELFGKEIDIKIDKNQTKLLMLVGFIISILISIYFFVVVPIRKVYLEKEALVQIREEKRALDQDVVILKKRYEKIVIEKKNQNNRLKDLLEKFKTHNLNDEAKLKQMVQRILDHLDIKLLEIGKTEEKLIEGSLEYNQKLIPYQISGKGKDISLFFYYIENSKTLLTVKGNRIEILSRSFDGATDAKGSVEVKFKLGYYNIISE